MDWELEMEMEHAPVWDASRAEVWIGSAGCSAAWCSSTDASRAEVWIGSSLSSVIRLTALDASRAEVWIGSQSM